MSVINIPKNGLKLNNEEIGNRLLKEVNGRSTKWTYSWSDLRACAADIERMLEDAGVSISNRPGIIATVRSHGPEKKRYGGYSNSAYGTHATFRRYRDGWRLIAVTKVVVYDGQRRDIKISVPKHEYEAIQKRAVEFFAVAKVAA